MWRKLLHLARDERGATAVEYGLIAALIVLAMFGALTLTADKTVAKWNYIEQEAVSRL